MDDQPICQHEIQTLGNGHVIDRDSIGECQGRNLGNGVVAAEFLSLGNLPDGDVTAIRIHDEMCVGTADRRAIGKVQLLHIVDILLNADFFGKGIHRLTGFLVIGFYPCFGNAVCHKLGKGGCFSIGKAYTGFPGKTARSTQNQAIGVFQQLAVYHDKVVGKGVDAVVQSFRAGLEQLLCGKGNEDRHAGSGQTALNLNLIHAQGQTAHKPFFLLEVQTGQRTVIFLRDAGSLEDVVVKLTGCIRRIHNEECQQEHSLVAGLQILQQLLGFRAVGSKVGRDNVHIVAGAHSLFLLLDFGFIQIGDLALDRLDGIDLIHRLHMEIDDDAALHIKEVCQHTVIQLRC